MMLLIISSICLVLSCLIFWFYRKPKTKAKKKTTAGSESTYWKNNAAHWLAKYTTAPKLIDYDTIRSKGEPVGTVTSFKDTAKELSGTVNLAEIQSFPDLTKGTIIATVSGPEGSECFKGTIKDGILTREYQVGAKYRVTVDSPCYKGIIFEMTRQNSLGNVVGKVTDPGSTGYVIGQETTWCPDNIEPVELVEAEPVNSLKIGDIIKVNDVGACKDLVARIDLKISPTSFRVVVTKANQNYKVGSFFFIPHECCELVETFKIGDVVKLVKPRPGYVDDNNLGVIAKVTEIDDSDQTWGKVVTPKGVYKKGQSNFHVMPECCELVEDEPKFKVGNVVRLVKPRPGFISDHDAKNIGAVVKITEEGNDFFVGKVTTGQGNYMVGEIMTVYQSSFELVKDFKVGDKVRLIKARETIGGVGHNVIGTTGIIQVIGLGGPYPMTVNITDPAGSRYEINQSMVVAPEHIELVKV